MSSPATTTTPLRAPSLPPPASDTDPDLNKNPSPGHDPPPLSFEVLTTEADRADALRLVADSIAQQRQQNSLALIFHPACVAALAVALALAWRMAAPPDLAVALAVCAGVLMCYLLAIRYVTGGYLAKAEAISWAWLRPPGGGDDDTILGARFGPALIAALVLRFEPIPAAASSSGRRRSLRHGRGLIRAWTTLLRYRRNGLGGDLLREAVRLTKERYGRDAELGFAAEHANSAVFLPEFFNRPLRRREQTAARALDAVLADWKAGKKEK